ncbi:hypothetical protein HOG47_01900 [archaeon]|nr:hypothetical protein [archaeon]MBT6773638.1 hypothetical protein [archaeon]
MSEEVSKSEKVEPGFPLAGSMWVPFLVAVLLMIVEGAMGYQSWAFTSDGLTKAWLLNWKQWITVGSGISAIIALAVFRGFHEFVSDWKQLFLPTFFVLVFITLGGPIALLHILGTGLVFFTTPMGNRSFIKEYNSAVVISALDFIIFGLILMFWGADKTMLAARYIWNINLMFVCGYGLQFQQKGALKVVMGIILGTMVFLVVFITPLTASYIKHINTVGPAELTNSIAFAFLDTSSNFMNYLKTGSHGVSQLFNMSQYSGGGSSEEPEDPQGLYLKELDQGDRPFRTGSKVYATAMLEAKTLEDPIVAQVICYTTMENDLGDEEAVMGKTNGNIGATQFTIISFSQHTVRCSFDQLPEGDYEIYFNATFDFAAEIRMKLYLMDRERLLNDQVSLENKGQDSSSENVLKRIYDIDDTDPEPIYTSGPIKLQLGTDNLPIDIGAGTIRQSQYSLIVENDWDKGGRIDKFNNIYIKIPDTFALSNPADSCDLPASITNEQFEKGFKTYKLDLDDRFTNIKDAIGVSCMMDLTSNSLDPTPITIRYVKAYVDYTYVMQEKTEVEVEGRGTSNNEVIVRNDICCKVDYEGGETKHYYVINNDECTNYNSDTSTATLVNSEFCENES